MEIKTISAKMFGKYCPKQCGAKSGFICKRHFSIERSNKLKNIEYHLETGTSSFDNDVPAC